MAPYLSLLLLPGGVEEALSLPLLLLFHVAVSGRALLLLSAVHHRLAAVVVHVNVDHFGGGGGGGMIGDDIC